MPKNTVNRFQLLAQEIANGASFTTAVQKVKPSKKGDRWVQRETKKYQENPTAYKERLGVGELLAQKEAITKRAIEESKKQIIRKFGFTGQVLHSGRLDFAPTDDYIRFKGLLTKYIPQIFSETETQPIFKIEIEGKSAINAKFSRIDSTGGIEVFHFIDINSNKAFCLNHNKLKNFTFKLSEDHNEDIIFTKIAEALESNQELSSQFN